MSVRTFLKSIEKKHGEVIKPGGFKTTYDRRPSGVFEFDLASNGGFPKGRSSILYGKEDSGKTTLALLAMVHNQRANPKEINLFVDVENNFDPERARDLGLDVDSDNFLHYLPDSSEQVVDVVEEAIYEKSMGIIIVDSLAALISNQEQENFADTAVVGGAGREIGKLYRKSTLAMNKARRVGRFPSLIYISQIRSKIGGNPRAGNDTMSGGYALKFSSSLTVRMYGKQVVNKDIDPDVPSQMEITCTFQKIKLPVLQKKVQFVLNMMDSPPKHRIGDTEGSWSLISNHLKNFNLLRKSDNGWILLDQEYRLQKDIKEAIQSDVALLDKVRSVLLEVFRTGEIPEKYL